jgi:hypothetical protein
LPQTHPNPQPATHNPAPFTPKPRNPGTAGNAQNPPGMGIRPEGRSLAAGMMAVRGPVAAPCGGGGVGGGGGGVWGLFAGPTRREPSPAQQRASKQAASKSGGKEDAPFRRRGAPPAAARSCPTRSSDRSRAAAGRPWPAAPFPRRRASVGGFRGFGSFWGGLKGLRFKGLLGAGGAGRLSAKKPPRPAPPPFHKQPPKQPPTPPCTPRSRSSCWRAAAPRCGATLS